MENNSSSFDLNNSEQDSQLGSIFQENVEQDEGQVYNLESSKWSHSRINHQQLVNKYSKNAKITNSQNKKIGIVQIFESYKIQAPLQKLTSHRLYLSQNNDGLNLLEQKVKRKDDLEERSSLNNDSERQQHQKVEDFYTEKIENTEKYLKVLKKKILEQQLKLSLSPQRNNQLSYDGIKQNTNFHSPYLEYKRDHKFLKKASSFLISANKTNNSSSILSKMSKDHIFSTPNPLDQLQNTSKLQSPFKLFPNQTPSICVTTPLNKSQDSPFQELLLPRTLNKANNLQPLNCLLLQDNEQKVDGRNQSNVNGKKQFLDIFKKDNLLSFSNISSTSIKVYQTPQKRGSRNSSFSKMDDIFNNVKLPPLKNISSSLERKKSINQSLKRNLNNRNKSADIIQQKQQQSNQNQQYQKQLIQNRNTNSNIAPQKNGLRSQLRDQHLRKDVEENQSSDGPQIDKLQEDSINEQIQFEFLKQKAKQLEISNKIFNSCRETKDQMIKQRIQLSLLSQQQSKLDDLKKYNKIIFKYSFPSSKTGQMLLNLKEQEKMNDSEQAAQIMHSYRQQNGHLQKTKHQQRIHLDLYD